jgi:hypothetical protein
MTQRILFISSSSCESSLTFNSFVVPPDDFDLLKIFHSVVLIANQRDKYCVPTTSSHWRCYFLLEITFCVYEARERYFPNEQEGAKRYMSEFTCERGSDAWPNELIHLGKPLRIPQPIHILSGIAGGSFSAHFPRFGSFGFLGVSRRPTPLHVG